MEQEYERELARAGISPGLMVRDVAEIQLLCGHLTRRQAGVDWQPPPLKTPSTTSDSGERPHDIDLNYDLRTFTSALSRLYKIRSNLLFYEPHDRHRDRYDEQSWDVYSEMAFLQRMKSICSKLATPATSRSIAFTALVTNDETESRWDRQWGDEPRYPPPYPFVGHLAELAYPGLRHDARSYAGFIQFQLPVGIASVTAALLIIFLLSRINVDNGGNGVLRIIGLIGNAALSFIPVLLGVLGAAASVLRRYQRLANANLLDPQLERKSFIDLWLGLIAGAAVGVLGIGLPQSIPGVTVALYIVSFLAGYSTELVFSLLDLAMVRLSATPLFRDQTPQMDRVIEDQVAIAGSVTQINDRLEQLQGNVTLDAFDGSVVVRVVTKNDLPIAIEDHWLSLELGGDSLKSDEKTKLRGVKITPGRDYKVVVALYRSMPEFLSAVTERILTGNDEERPNPAAVSFSINVTSRDIQFSPCKQIIQVGGITGDQQLRAHFVAPGKPGRYDILAEVSQKNRIVQVAMIPAIVE